MTAQSGWDWGQGAPDLTRRDGRVEIPWVGIFVWVTVGFPVPGTVPGTGLATSS